LKGSKKPVGQQDFEQTPLALSALNRARSFDDHVRAVKYVRSIVAIVESNVRHRRPPAVSTMQRLTRSFFTAK
jgi:hypothetical protein